MKIDMHIHSNHSRDGAATVEEILERCSTLGLHGCAVVDHNSVQGSLRASELGPSYGLLVVPGTEISTSEGHVLAYGVTAGIPKGMAIDKTIQLVHDSGGIAVAAHPRRFPSGIGIRRASENAFDAVETLNGGSSSGSNRSSARLADRTGRPEIGGSDAHVVGEIGRAYTVVPDVGSWREVIEAILSRKSSVEGRSRTVKETVVYAKETMQEWVRGGFERM